MTGDSERLHYFNFETSFLENKNFFKKIFQTLQSLQSLQSFHRFLLNFRSFLPVKLFVRPTFLRNQIKSNLHFVQDLKL